MKLEVKKIFTTSTLAQLHIKSEINEIRIFSPRIQSGDPLERISIISGTCEYSACIYVVT